MSSGAPVKKETVICPVCGNSGWREAYAVCQWNIYECLFCRFAAIIPAPEMAKREEFYNEEAVVGRNTKKLSLSRCFSRCMKQAGKSMFGRNKSGIFYEKLKRYIPAGSKVLDVGCGDGSFISLANQKYACAGIEISEYLSDGARKRGLEVMTGDFMAMDFGTEKYDGITFVSLLEHLVDPMKAVRKCFGLLNNNGVLLIKTVNYSCLNRRIKRQRWTGLRPPDHVVYFSPSNLRTLLQKAGFSRITISAYPFNDSMYCDAVK